MNLQHAANAPSFISISTARTRFDELVQDALAFHGVLRNARAPKPKWSIAEMLADGRLMYASDAPCARKV